MASFHSQTQQRLHLRICRSEGREMDAVSFLGRHWNSSFSYGFFAILHLRSAPFQPPWRYLWRGQSWAKDREPQDNVWLGSNVQLMSIVFPMCFVPAKKNMLMKSPSLSPWKMVTSSRRLSWWLDHPCLWRKFEPVAQLFSNADLKIGGQASWLKATKLTLDSWDFGRNTSFFL